MRETYDLVVIGGGPGGYPAAIRAAQLGLSVAIVEPGNFGGECTNYGCIPSKALISPVESYWRVKNLPFMRGEVEVDFEGLMKWAKSIVSRTRSGVLQLLKGYGVDVYQTRGYFESSTTVRLGDGGTLRADKFVVATGTEPARIPGIEIDGAVVHDNRTILGLKKKPSTMLIIGGGYIGVEYANVFAKLGVEVHLVEMLPRLLPQMDQDVSRIIERRLRKLGVKVRTRARVESVELRESFAKARISGGEEVEADAVLVAVGRRPVTRDLGLEKAGVRLDGSGFIKVNEHMETSNPRILASGDVSGPPLLAHKAFHQAVVAAENAAGLDTAYEPMAVPEVVFTDPEVVSIGLKEEEARERGFKARAVRYPLGGSPRAAIEDSIDGFVKIVYDDDSKTLLGVQIVAPHASEIAAEAVYAIETGATLEDLALTIHPHPTISEALKEAAELALERPIHYVLRRKK
ncbi:MAG: dihydrolipoyl dehydrogenase [Desulfurococcales archaeon]|nr:dihydrolipoyl dehydrogenase [Desulfurococcales archaeon]